MGLFCGYGCQKCSSIEKGKALRYTHDEAVARITQISGGKISVLGEYQGVGIPLKVQCSDCGHKWSPVPGSLFQGVGCQNVRNMVSSLLNRLLFTICESAIRRDQHSTKLALRTELWRNDSRETVRA